MSSRLRTSRFWPWMSAFAAGYGAIRGLPRASFLTSLAPSLIVSRTRCNRCQRVRKSDVLLKDNRNFMAHVRSSGYVMALVFSGFFLSLLSRPAAWAELKPGELLSQENWQEAKGLLPDAILHRFQDGSYQA